MSEVSFFPSGVIADRFQISGPERPARGVLIVPAVEIATGAAVQLVIAAGDAAEFLAKARRLARLHHQNVAALREILFDADRPVAVCEAPSGVDLTTWRRELGRAPSAAEFDEIARPLLDAVATLHGVGVVHFAVTPSAITRGPDGCVTLAPFGASDADAFSPPELSSGSSASAGERADVFGCAATLSALISGRPPSLAGGLPAPLSAAGSDIPEETLQTVAVAASPDPADRPPSIRALAALLFDFAAVAPRAPAEAAKPRAPLRKRRPTATWAALAALVAVLLGGLYALDLSPPWRELARRASPLNGVPVVTPEVKAEDPTAERLAEMATTTDRDLLAAQAKEGAPAGSAATARLEALGYVRARGGVALVWLKPGGGEGFRDCADCPELVSSPGLAARTLSR